jgi:hypothetical protein
MLHFAWKRGRYTPPDRKVLEEEILPLLASEEGVERILSVGVAWYTKGYEAAFTSKGKSFTTLDVDPERSSFGSQRSQHITGDVRDLERLVMIEDAFDLILLNGVIGYGLDDPKDVDAALVACHARLKRGGTLVIGINEEKPTNVDPFSVGSHLLFERRPLGRWKNGRVMIPVPFREKTHTFLFWRKR